MNITPLKSEFSKLDGLNVRIRDRATALLNLLGAGGRMVLTKSDIKALINWTATMSRREATAVDHRSFAELESRLQREHGATAKLFVAVTDGVIDAERDPRKWVPTPAPVPMRAAPVRRCPCCHRAGSEIIENLVPDQLPSNAKHLFKRGGGNTRRGGPKAA